jgi:hypothetical protein
MWGFFPAAALVSHELRQFATSLFNPDSPPWPTFATSSSLSYLLRAQASRRQPLCRGLSTPPIEPSKQSVSRLPTSSPDASIEQSRTIRDVYTPRPEEVSGSSSRAPGHSDPTAGPSPLRPLANPAVCTGSTPGQAHTIPHFHPTFIPRPRRHPIKMAPSATDEPAPMQLPVTSKASTINASVLHGPRDLRLVNSFLFLVTPSPCPPSFPRSRIDRLHEVRVPVLLFLDPPLATEILSSPSGTMLTNMPGHHRSGGASRTPASASFKSPSRPQASVALMSRTTRSLPMETSVPACLCPWDTNLPVLLSPLDPKSRASALATVLPSKLASRADSVASAVEVVTTFASA